MAGLKMIERETDRLDEREKEIILIVDYIRSQPLSFFEEAAAIQNLIENYGLTQEEAAEKLGRVQSTIANKLRLLRLTAEERKIIIDNSLTERHSRALLRIASPEDRMKMLEKVVGEKLNVDSTERLIDEFVGNERSRQNYKKRVKLFGCITSLVNSLNKSVESMKFAGIDACFCESEGEGYIEYSVKIFHKK